MHCLDNSVVTIDRIDDTQRKIDFYKEHIKTGDWSDIFYERHLAILELGLSLIRDKLKDIDTKEDWVNIKYVDGGVSNLSYADIKLWLNYFERIKI